jgi:hypothetical protein
MIDYIKAMQLALAALQSNFPEQVSGHREPVDSYDTQLVNQAIAALHKAIPSALLAEKRRMQREANDEAGHKSVWWDKGQHAND